MLSEPSTLDGLVADLRELRRGHGLFAADAPQRASRQLGLLCGVGPADDEAATRHKLLVHLTDLAATLPDFYRPVVQAALALAPETREMYLLERMQWAAEQVNRDHARTALRRLDPGLTLLAESLLLRPPPPDVPHREWHIRRLDTDLRLDLDRPLLTETRRIRALVDGFDQLVAEISAPQDFDAGPTPVRASMLFGGEIVAEDVSSRHYASFTIRLPRPLAFAEEHEYRIQFTGPLLARMRPYYVLTPYRTCDHFSIRIRFAADAPPTRVQRLAGIPSRRLDEYVPDGEPIALTGDHEIHEVFTPRNLGLSYGVQWQPAPG